MNAFRHTMLAAAVVAGLGISAHAADDASQQSGQQSSQQQQTDATGSAQQAGARQGAGQQQGDKSPDGMFAKTAAINGMKEVQLAKIAQQNASSEDVKQLAQHIERDHQQANDQLKPIAQQLGVQIPSDLPQEKKEIVQYFQSLQGQQFDQEYVSAMKAAHAHDISKFQDKAAVAQNPELKQWAAQCLPKLQQHQQHVMAAAQQVGLPAGGSATALGQGVDAAQTAGQRLGTGSSSDTTGSASENGLGQSGSRSGSSGQSTGSGTSGTSSGGSSGSSSTGGSSGSSGSSSGAGTGSGSSR